MKIVASDEHGTFSTYSDWWPVLEMVTSGGDGGETSVV